MKTATEFCSSGHFICLLILGYWPSYNVPFFNEIYKRSGYPEVVKKHGTDFSYQLAPRAKIFRRDQATVKDMPTMKKIMRYNGKNIFVNFNPYSQVRETLYALVHMSCTWVALQVS